MVDFTSSIFPVIESPCVNIAGNLPALFKPGPRIRGICLINESEAKKASYLLAIKHYIYLIYAYKLYTRDTVFISNIQNYKIDSS